MPSSTSGARPAGPSKLRGFATRSVVGAALIAIVAASLAWFHWGLVGLIAAFVALGAHELGHAAAIKGWHPAWQLVAVGGAGIIVLGYGGWVSLAGWGELAPLVIGVLAGMPLVLAAWVWRLRGPTDGYFADIAVTTLMMVYLPGLASFVVMMMRSVHPVANVVVFIACIVINDSGAYIMGSLLGRHHMTPHISPAKTWEGLAGGIVWSGVAGALLVWLVLGAPWWQGVVAGVVLGVCAALGDLIESAIKRDTGQKDMGKLLPGHGGVMDRVDSLLFCAPVAWALLCLWISA